MQTGDAGFAVHIRPIDHHWSWVVIDTDGQAADNGRAETEELARHQANVVANSMTRFRMVTQGGW